MGKQEIIKDIVFKLKNDPYFGVSLYSESELGRLCIGQNLTREHMEQKAGSVEEYFNQLFKNGVTKLGIEIRRKNGTNPRKNTVNWKTVGDYQVFNLSSGDVQTESKNMQQPTAPAPQPQQPVYEAPVYQQLNSPLANPFGLSAPEIIRLNVKASDAERLERELSELKPKYEALVKRVGEMEIEKLQWTDKKASAESNASLLGSIIEKGPEIIQAISQMKVANPSVAAAPGLSVPNNLNDHQNQLIEVVVNNDPAISEMLLRLANGFDNENFVQQLNDLLTQQQL